MLDLDHSWMFVSSRSISLLAVIVWAALPFPALCQVVPPAPTTLPAPLTLKEAIAIALRQQPQQYIARDQITQAQGQKQQAQSQYLPTLTPTYQYQNRSQSVYGLNTGSSFFPGSTVPVNTGTSTGTGTGTGIGNGTGTGTGVGTTTGTGTGAGVGAASARAVTGTGTGTGSGTSNPVTTTNTINEVNFVHGGGLSVSLTQNLYDGGRREAANAEARHTLDASAYNSINTRQNTILTVTQDYYQLLLALDLVKVAQAQVARYQQTVDATQAQIDAGTTAAIGIYQSKADLATAQVTLLQDQNQVRTTSATLKNALGVATDEVVQPAPLTTGDQLPPLPSAGPDVTLDASLVTAFADRPDLNQQQSNVAVQNSALQQSKREAGVTISSDYVLNYQATNDVGTRGLASQLLVTGTYPLFDAGNARGAIRIAQAGRDSALNQLEQVRQQIRLEVEQAYSTRETSLQAAQLAQAAVTAAQVNYDSAVAARREGIGTVLDITTAQATLTQAQNQYVTAIYNFYIADAQLVRATGRNDAGLPGGR
ncbi:MAG: TolC family protein [Armatimonadota bacterium]|nr:TolC family protein [Armatimonadota bacterium]